MEKNNVCGDAGGGDFVMVGFVEHRGIRSALKRKWLFSDGSQK
jgi:hypothetical protein